MEYEDLFAPEILNNPNNQSRLLNLAYAQSSVLGNKLSVVFDELNERPSKRKIKQKISEANELIGKIRNFPDDELRTIKAAETKRKHNQRSATVQISAEDKEILESIREELGEKFLKNTVSKLLEMYRLASIEKNQKKPIGLLLKKIKE